MLEKPDLAGGDREKLVGRDDVSKVLAGEGAAAVDQLERRMTLRGAALEQRLGVGRTQPDQQAVVGRQPVDDVAQTGER